MTTVQPSVVLTIEPGDTLGNLRAALAGLDDLPDSATVVLGTIDAVGDVIGGGPSHPLAQATCVQDQDGDFWFKAQGRDQWFCTSSEGMYPRTFDALEKDFGPLKGA